MLHTSEIRIRAWNPKTKEFVPTNIIDFPTLIYSLSTKFKDTKGIEIYEGDILEIKEIDKRGKYASVIIHFTVLGALDESIKGIKKERRWYYPNKPPHKQTTTKEFLTPSQLEMATIIGNIFQPNSTKYSTKN